MDKERITKIIEAEKANFDRYFPEGWFLSGSTYLVYNGYLDRPIHDIDIMTVADHYSDPGFDSDLWSIRKDCISSKFKDDEGNEIHCLGIYLTKYGESLDVMYNPSSTKENVLEQIIKYKLRCIHDPYSPKDAVNKHIADITALSKFDECRLLIEKYSK